MSCTANSLENPAAANCSKSSMAALLSAAAFSPVPMPSDTAKRAVPLSLSRKEEASPQGLPISPAAKAVAAVKAKTGASTNISTQPSPSRWHTFSSTCSICRPSVLRTTGRMVSRQMPLPLHPRTTSRTCLPLPPFSSVTCTSRTRIPAFRRARVRLSCIHPVSICPVSSSKIPPTASNCCPTRFRHSCNLPAQTKS